MTTPAGIASIGLKLPSLAMKLEELATLRNVDPNKYTIGLGCREMALCKPSESVVDLAAEAARRALSRWPGELGDIGMIAVGTESAMDMSRPLSAFVAEEIGLEGYVRSYEVKHACYGGTLALRQALEWKWSGACAGKAALVIAADIARYAPAHPGEPTQGGGAVAFIIADPSLAAVDKRSYAWSEPAFDFWRPVGDSYPQVQGQLSLYCYNRATLRCVEALLEVEPDALDQLSALCFHVPFPKMVKKAIAHIGTALGWDDDATSSFFADKVEPTLEGNRYCGNGYTSSLWLSVAHTLAGLTEGQRIAAFSYGSGYGAELLTLSAGPLAQTSAWMSDWQDDLAARTFVDGETYLALRTAEQLADE
ncbi:MAG: hydroxymethylglutaryl-CoA synthase [Myxococcota bacterium]